MRRLARWRLVLHRFRPTRWQVLGTLLLFAAWEVVAWKVFLDNPRRADLLLPRLEFVIGTSFSEFATFYGLDQGLRGFRQDAGQAFLVLLDSSLITLRRVLIGVGAGIAGGVGVGLLIGWSRWIRNVVLPPILLLRTIPVLALIPLFLFWFGTREIGILVFIAFTVFSMMIITTIEAIRNVSPVYQDYARSFGASRWRVYRTIVLPAIVPSLTGGIRVVFGLSWAIVLAGEFLTADSGLGHLLILSERHLKTGRMVVVVVVFVIFSLLLNALFLVVSGWLTRWVPRVERRAARGRPAGL